MKTSAFALLLIAFAAPLGAANIVIVNTDAAGTGFNDPTPVAPVGGNTGTTVGAQRLIVFQQAATFWGNLLTSAVTINVDSSFQPLTCTATSATLGSAGPTTIFSDFPNAPVAGTWYAKALADKLRGSEINATVKAIRARFNSQIGQTGCLTGTSFYLGLDNNHGTNVNLLTVVLHEFGHGLGFVSGADATGAFPGAPAMPYIFDRFIFDDTLGMTWDQMTTSQRGTSAINTGNLTWNGANANAFAATYLGKQRRLQVTSPVAVAGNYIVGLADFGPALASPGVTGQIVAAQDPSDMNGPSTTDGCTALTNASAVAGTIALIDRGTCSFAIKVKNAQNAGAIAAIIVNNVGSAAGMGGSDATITIPSVMVGQTEGGTLRANLPANGNIGIDSTLLAGADAAGRMLLFAPNPYVSGSSVSHFDTSAFPNLLMEPAINTDLPIGVDATLPLLKDLGWTGPTSGSTTTTWILPTSTHAGGANGAFFTTDVGIANFGTTDASYTMQFLGNNQDGRTGPTQNFTLGAGKSVVFTDVVGSIFGLAGTFGSIRVTANTASLKISSVTSTPGGVPGGTFGQGIPAAAASDWVTNGTARAMTTLRDDTTDRTNLVIANATESNLDVSYLLKANDGSVLAQGALPTFAPLEMRQINHVIQNLSGSTAAVANATLVLSTPTVGGAFASFCSLIDNLTNDPRTLLPTSATTTTWILPTSTHASGANGAFFTTDLGVANFGTTDASFSMQFLGNNQDGRAGPVQNFTLAAGKSVLYADVVGSVFGLSGTFGSIRITANTASLKISSVTSTPGGVVGGTFGQGIPAATASDWVANGTSRAMTTLREDTTDRTNLVIANATESNLDVSYVLKANDGSVLAQGALQTFAPLEMRQINRVIQNLTGSQTPVSNATLILSTPTVGGAFASFCSLIDNLTNDPRTLLP